MKNYYKILGVPMNAGPEEIKQAYRSLLQIYDPQQPTDDRYSQERYQNITIAYNTLMNADRRRDYDRILSSILSPAEMRELQRARQSLEKDSSPVLPSFEPSMAPPQALKDQDRGKTMPLPSSLPAQRRSRLRPLAYIAASLALVLVPGYFLFQLASSSDLSSSEPLAWNAWSWSNSPALQAAKPSPASTSSSKAVAAPSPRDSAPLPSPKPAPVTARKAEPTTSPSLSEPMVAREEKESRPAYAPKNEGPASSRAEESLAQNRETEIPTIGGIQEPLPLGTSQVEVLKKQGTPATIVRYGPDQETWLYLNGSIHFRNGRMISYNSEQQPLGLIHPRTIGQ